MWSWQCAARPCPLCVQTAAPTRRAVRAALKAAKELRNIGVQRPVVFIISMYNKQVRSTGGSCSLPAAYTRAKSGCPLLPATSRLAVQRDLITRLVETSKHGAKLRAECASCQVRSCVLGHSTLPRSR